MIRWPNVGEQLAHRLRRWPNSKPTFGQRLMLTVVPVTLPRRHTTWNPRGIGVENWWTRRPTSSTKNPGVFHVDFFMCKPIIGVDLQVDIKRSLRLIFYHMYRGNRGTVNHGAQ